jgi:hypothetical protein
LAAVLALPLQLLQQELALLQRLAYLLELLVLLLLTAARWGLL